MIAHQNSLDLLRQRVKRIKQCLAKFDQPILAYSARVTTDQLNRLEHLRLFSRVSKLVRFP